jgi:hypothetical protein
MLLIDFTFGVDLINIRRYDVVVDDDTSKERVL